MKFILPNRQYLHNGFGWNLVFGIMIGLMLLVEDSWLNPWIRIPE